MTEKKQIYKCKMCGNIVEILHGGAGQLVCCEREMKHMIEKTAEPSKEKHVPYVKIVENGYVIKVGENAEHPMENNHYIEWIEIVVDEQMCRKYLKPGDKPQASFRTSKGREIYSREYCNIHGLWSIKVKANNEESSECEKL